jgi:hypothetical protein
MMNANITGLEIGFTSYQPGQKEGNRNAKTVKW